MKKICTISFFFIILISISVQAGNYYQETNTDYSVLVPLSDPPVYLSSPDWISSNPHYSTGGAMADINQDGWLDLVVSDGNDMAQGKVHVYLNNGNGALPTTSSWQSTDIAYNGHLDIADVNGDGWPDVAVAYLGTSSSFAPIARLYLNNNGILSSTADWSANINGNAFGVAFGDMNNDGRPDLAIATGWSYSPQHPYQNYVYLNSNGMLSATPSWSSSDMNHYHGALWVDADHDGWLDLAYIGQGVQTQIYRNIGGTLTPTAFWQTSDSALQDGLMLATGDVNNDGNLDLFTTDNTQLGGSGQFKQYLGLATGFFQTTASWTYYEGYGSAVAVADVNHDSFPDLATGGWWDNTRIFMNTGSALPITPTWNSGGTSVVEKIIFGNIGPLKNERTTTTSFTGTGSQHLFYLPHQNIQFIQSVLNDGIILTPDEYTYSRVDGWLCVATAPTIVLDVCYNYSNSLDMAITNWDSTIGNYLYYNQLGEPDLDVTGEINWTNVQPGSSIYDTFEVVNIGDLGSELDWIVTETPSWGNFTITPSFGIDLIPEQGPQTVYVEIDVPTNGSPIFEGEIRIENQHDPSDYGIIPVRVELSGGPGPIFTIDAIEGKIGVSIAFHNSGKGEATDVQWNLEVSGGMLNLINKSLHDRVISLSAGESHTISSGLFLGIGNIKIQFMITCNEGATKQIQATGKQFLIFTSIKN
jgi:hypothetical protein